MERISGFQITISDVAIELHDIGVYLKRHFDAEELREPWDHNSPGYTDVRLQVTDRGWSVHSGDASYDTDGRGYWGTGLITRGASWAECRAMARILIGEAADDAAAQLS